MAHFLALMVSVSGRTDPQTQLSGTFTACLMPGIAALSLQCLLFISERRRKCSALGGQRLIGINCHKRSASTGSRQPHQGNALEAPGRHGSFSGPSHSPFLKYGQEAQMDQLRLLGGLSDPSGLLRNFFVSIYSNVAPKVHAHVASHVEWPSNRRRPSKHERQEFDGNNKSEVQFAVIPTGEAPFERLQLAQWPQHLRSTMYPDVHFSGKDFGESPQHLNMNFEKWIEALLLCSRASPATALRKPTSAHCP